MHTESYQPRSGGRRAAIAAQRASSSAQAHRRIAPRLFPGARAPERAERRITLPTFICIK